MNWDVAEIKAQNPQIWAIKDYADLRKEIAASPYLHSASMNFSVFVQILKLQILKNYKENQFLNLREGVKASRKKPRWLPLPSFDGILFEPDFHFFSQSIKF